MRAIIAASAVALLVGCATNEEVSTTSITSAELPRAHVVAIDAALHEITRAQCARTQACGAVATRGIYRGADYCDSDVRSATRDDLLGHGCKYVDGARLAECLEAVQNQDCGSMNVTEKAPDECRSARLCH